MRRLLLPFLLGFAACGKGSDDPYEALSRKIERREPEVRKEARDQLIQLGGDRAAEILIRVARTESEERLILAMGGLSSLGDCPRAVQAMIGFLAHPSVNVRREAALLVAYDENPLLVPSLLRGASDSDAEVRRTCLSSLEWRGVAEALPLFKAALQDPDAEARKIGEKGVFKLEWRERAREICFHAPASTPYPKGTKEEKDYLQGYRGGWDYAIGSISPESIEAGTLRGSGATCCEAPESVTRGWYAGSHDVDGFLDGVRFRIAADPTVKREFARYRLETIAASPEGK